MEADKRRAGVVLWDLGGVVVDVDIERGRAAWRDFGGHPGGFDAAFFESGLKDRWDDGRTSLRAGLDEILATIDGQLSEAEVRRSFEAILTARPAVTRLIRQVAERTRCLVISNTDPIHGPWIEANAGISEVIESWVYSYDERAMKPAPALYLAALARAAAPANSALLIDDRADNIAAAAALGMDTIRFTSFEAVESGLRTRGLIA